MNLKDPVIQAHIHKEVERRLSRRREAIQLMSGLIARPPDGSMITEDDLKLAFQLVDNFLDPPHDISGNIEVNRNLRLDIHEAVGRCRFCKEEMTTTITEQELMLANVNSSMTLAIRKLNKQQGKPCPARVCCLDE